MEKSDETSYNIFTITITYVDGLEERYNTNDFFWKMYGIAIQKELEEAFVVIPFDNIWEICIEKWYAHKKECFDTIGVINSDEVKEISIWAKGMVGQESEPQLAYKFFMEKEKLAIEEDLLWIDGVCRMRYFIRKNLRNFEVVFLHGK